jgi:penicillin-binding protein 2
VNDVSAYLRRSRSGGERRWPIRTGRSDRPVVQLPSVALRVVLVGAIAVALIGVIVFRLWFLQILSAQQYVAQANDNRLRSVAVLAPRGTILDRSGAVMVDNRPGLAVGIRPMDVPAEQLRPLIARLALLLRMKPAAIRSEIVRQVGVPLNQVRQGLGLQYDFVTIKQDTDRRIVSFLLEHTLSYPGVEVRQNYLRDYPLGELGAHFLGQLGEISEKELTEPQFHGYAAGDVVGQSGVEYTYDKWLRGVDGSVRVEVDASGRPKQVVPGGTLPQAGDNLQLSIDSRVQRAAENAVNYGIDLAHANNELRADGGAAVVLDVHTGEVIAMASEPTFNPAWFVGGLSTKHWKKLNVKTTPLLDRATQGQYALGSTFKVVDSIAGLENGVITAGTTYDCTGAYTPPHTLDKAVWHCWIYPGSHGSLDLTQAIVQSCDVYFYNVGYDFYSQKGEGLEDWAKRLGMGHPTGIDLPGEVAGLVPTPEWKNAAYTRKTDPIGWRIDRLWKPGDSINLAIGQGNLEATPMQAAVTYAAIANGGYLVTPHLGVRIVNSQGKLVRRLPYRQPHRLGISASTIATVQNALHEAATTPAGTSYPVFGHYNVAVAGKTGTAQVAGQGDYAWYCSYAPANDPQYVVVVMIQQGGHGGVSAAPAARMIYDSLFHVSGGQVTGAVHSD